MSNTESSKIFKIIPRTTGTVVIKKIWIIILPIEYSKGKTCPVTIGYVNEKIRGTVTKQSKLITAVNEMDSATSPPANFEITFVVTPPGAAASNISPTFNSTGKGKINAIDIAIKGKIIT